MPEDRPTFSDISATFSGELTPVREVVPEYLEPQRNYSSVRSGGETNYGALVGKEERM